MPECQVCGGADFDEIQGHFYCTVCQTQSQDVRVLEVEEACGEFPGVTNRIREKTTDKPKKAVKDVGRPWSIYEAYQVIIQHQVEALIKLGAHKSLKDIVFRIWVNYLSKLGVAFSDGPKLVELEKYEPQRELYPGTTTKPQTKNVIGLKLYRRVFGIPAKKADKIQSVDRLTEALAGEEFYEGDNPLADGNDSGDDLEYSSDDDPDVQKGRSRSNRRSVCKMQKKFTLTFCYMGLMYTNPGLTLSDLLRWVKKGQVPYTNVLSLFPEDLAFNMDDVIHFYKSQVSPSKVYRNLTAKLSHFLGLKEYPNFPFTELISKYILLLDLPAEMHSLVINLYRLKPVKVNYSNQVHHTSGYFLNLPFWEGRALAYIIMTLKLYFGLNDHTEKLFSVYSRELMKLIDYNHQLFVWDDWMKHMKIKCHTSDYFTTSSHHEQNIQTLSETAVAEAQVHKRTKGAPKERKYQPEVRDRISEPFIELGNRWKARRTETGTQAGRNISYESSPSLEQTSYQLIGDDPIGLLLGNYDDYSMDVREQPLANHSNEQTQSDVEKRSVLFRKSSLRHLSDPETYLDKLDRHGLADYTILSSYGGSADSHIDEGEPETRCQGDVDWDPDLSQIKEENAINTDNQSSSQASLRQFIKDNIDSVPSCLKIKNRARYDYIIKQVQQIKEKYLLNFEVDNWSGSLSYKWLLHLCSMLVDCPTSELANEVRLIESLVCDFRKKGKHRLSMFDRQSHSAEKKSNEPFEF